MDINEKQEPKKLPPNSLWIDFTVAFLKGLAIILVLSGLVGLVGCSSQAVENWKPATQLYSQEILMQVAADNSSSAVSQDLYKKLQAIPINEQLTLFKFNDPGFCGQFGCLHTAYLKQGKEFKQVWARYLDPHLPRNTNLVQLVKKPPNGKIAQSRLPCLQFVQVSPINHLLHQTTECFNGQTYQIVEKRNVLVVRSGRSKP